MLYVSIVSCAQTNDPMQYANSIDIQDIQEQVTLLTSREFEGREAGKPGGRRAAKYIQQKFEVFKEE